MLDNNAFADRLIEELSGDVVNKELPLAKLFTYKERSFTGFAPCFENGLLSLACCKGNKANGGLRRRACKVVEAGKAAWVLSIAGKDIPTKGHNKMDIGYSWGDLIYIARVSGIESIYSWREYDHKFGNPRRFDAIYEPSEDGKGMVRVKCNQTEHLSGENSKHETDLGVGIDDYPNVKQILTTSEYVVFEAGCRLSEQWWNETGRRMREKDNDLGILSQADVLAEMIRTRAAYVGASPFRDKLYRFTTEPASARCKKDKGVC